MNIPEFKSIPKAITIDLDGTLLNTSLRISPRNLNTLKKCFAMNIPVILSTARPERAVHRLCPPEILKRCSLVLSNGAITRGMPPLSGFYQQKLAPGITQKIVNLARDYDSDVRITIEIEGFDFGTDWKWDPVSL